MAVYADFFFRRPTLHRQQASGGRGTLLTSVFLYEFTRLTWSQRKSEPEDDRETAALKQDPTLPVSTHLQPQ